MRPNWPQMPLGSVREAQFAFLSVREADTGGQTELSGVFWKTPSTFVRSHR